MIADWGKLALLSLVILVTAFLGGVHVLEPDDTRDVLLLTLGYLTGNGVLARRREAPSPVLAPRNLEG